MQIECILRREGGTQVTLDSDGDETTYDFQPDPSHAGAHVAAVDDPDHIGIFLAIPEGYRVAGGKARPRGAAPAPEPKRFDPMDLPGDADGHDDDDEDEDDEPAPAPDDGRLTADRIDAMSRDELAAEFERREGRKPNGRTTAETLRDTLKGLIADE